MKKTYAIFILLALINLTFLSCKKQDDSGITASFYFTAEIDGQKVVFENGKNGYGSGIGASGGTVPAGCMKEQSMNITRGLKPNESAGVVILKTFSDCYVDCSSIEGMFSIRNYSFGKHSKSSSQNGIDGAVVYYVDKDGVQWWSDNGTAIQTNSNFKIVENIPNTDGYSNKISKAEFNCVLYDDNGNAKVLTNGIIRGRSVTCRY